MRPPSPELVLSNALCVHTCAGISIYLYIYTPVRIPSHECIATYTRSRAAVHTKSVRIGRGNLPSESINEVTILVNQERHSGERSSSTVRCLLSRPYVARIHLPIIKVFLPQRERVSEEYYAVCVKSRTNKCLLTFRPSLCALCKLRTCRAARRISRMIRRRSVSVSSTIKHSRDVTKLGRFSRRLPLVLVGGRIIISAIRDGYAGGREGGRGDGDGPRARASRSGRARALVNFRQ